MPKKSTATITTAVLAILSNPLLTRVGNRHRPVIAVEHLEGVLVRRNHTIDGLHRNVYPTGGRAASFSFQRDYLAIALAFGREQCGVHVIKPHALINLLHVIEAQDKPTVEFPAHHVS